MNDFYARYIYAEGKRMVGTYYCEKGIYIVSDGDIVSIVEAANPQDAEEKVFGKGDVGNG